MCGARRSHRFLRRSYSTLLSGVIDNRRFNNWKHYRRRLGCLAGVFSVASANPWDKACEFVSNLIDRLRLLHITPFCTASRRLTHFATIPISIRGNNYHYQDIHFARFPAAAASLSRNAYFYNRIARSHLSIIHVEGLELVSTYRTNDSILQMKRVIREGRGKERVNRAGEFEADCNK